MPIAELGYVLRELQFNWQYPLGWNILLGFRSDKRQDERPGVFVGRRGGHEGIPHYALDTQLAIIHGLQYHQLRKVATLLLGE